MANHRDGAMRRTPAAGAAGKNGEDRERWPALEVNRSKYYPRTTRPFCGQPVEVGYFSQDDDMEIYMDRREARRCVLPSPHERIHFDLDEGFSEFQWKDESNPKGNDMNPFLVWILENRDKLKNFQGAAAAANSAESAVQTDFIMSRGKMTRFLTAPYRGRGWALLLVRYRNAVFIRFDPTSKLGHQRPMEEQPELCQRQTHRGYRLEAYLARHIDPAQAKRSQSGNTARFMSVVQAQLGQLPYSMLIMAETDGELDPDTATPGEGPAPPSNYVEVKMYQEKDSGKALHMKLLKVWAQAYSVGVETVAIGYRDDAGIVRRVKTFKTFDLPSICREYWKADICLNFARDLFTWLDENVRETDPLTEMYELTFRKPFDRMLLRKVRIAAGREGVLTREFVEATQASGLPAWRV